MQTQRLKKQKPSELLCGVAGTLSLLPSECNAHFISKDYPSSNRTSSCPSSPKQFEKQEPSVAKVRNLWSNRQSKPPSHMWLRPSGQATGQTPDWMQTVRLASSSKNSGEDTRIKTKTGKSRKLSPPGVSLKKDAGAIDIAMGISVDAAPHLSTILCNEILRVPQNKVHRRESSDKDPSSLKFCIQESRWTGYPSFSFVRNPHKCRFGNYHVQIPEK